ncbi:MAG: alpha/beta hydrolase fold domain-containing protein [Eggerthellaceae bacterium]
MAPKFYHYDLSQWKRHYADVVYAHQDPRQKMDIILPDEGEGPFPLIVFVHGGGWVSGDKRENTMPGAFKAVSQGYALASVEYRLAPDATWPMPLYDVKAAVRFLRAHAKEYHLKTDKICAWGNSAGGHLVNMLAATGGRTIEEDVTMGNPDESCAVQCLVAFYSPSDMYQIDITNQLPQDELTDATGTDVGQSDSREGMNFPHNMVAGFKLSRNRAAAAYLSPINFVTKDFPPAYFIHGIADPIVPYTQSVAMSNMINETAGAGPAKFELIPNAVHGDEAMKTDEMTNKVLDFIDSIIWEGPHKRTPLPKELKVIGAD